MIKFENTEVVGWEAAIRGMRNPMNSWSCSDSVFIEDGEYHDICGNGGPYNGTVTDTDMFFEFGSNDHDLMMRLRNAGTDHRKFMRMIVVYVDILAPLYWWKEFDTYKVGTVANSCSTMHKIHEKEFTMEDFSHEHLFGEEDMLEFGQRTDIDKDIALAAINVDGERCYFTPKSYIQMTCNILNRYRKKFIETNDKKFWWQMIQLLPSSYNQRRTVMFNYEVLSNIYKSRKNHKLDEWRSLCKWIETLPYSELITGGVREISNP